MAWSPQARAAAITARRRKGHVKYKVVVKTPGGKPQIKAKLKKTAKYTGIGLAAGATVGAAYQANKYSSSPQRAANLRKKAEIARVKSNAARKFSRQGLNVPKTRVNSKAFDRASIRYGRQHAKYKAKAKYVTAKGIYKAR